LNELTGGEMPVGLSDRFVEQRRPIDVLLLFYFFLCEFLCVCIFVFIYSVLLLA